MIKWVDFIEKSKDMTISELAEYYGKPESYIRLKLTKAKIKAKKKTFIWNNPEIVKRVIELSEKDLNKRQITKELNISITTLDKIISRNNIQLMLYKKKATREEMICYLRNKFTLESIGLLFGLSKQRIKQICDGVKNEKISG